MPRIEFLGVGDATDFELGQTSVFYHGGCRLLVDCGPQIPQVLVTRLTSADELDGIFVSHCHADHCFGLASLLLWLRQHGRKRPLVLMAEANVLTAVTQLIELGYPGAFDRAKCFTIEACPLSTERHTVFGAATLRIAATEHNLPNYALCIDEGGVASAFSGDGRSTVETTELYVGVQLLVHECAFLEHVSSSHMNAGALLDVQRAARPKRLAVVHCAREQRDAIEARMTTELGQAVVFPRPGQSYDVSTE
jgi:ribonuclease Z